MSDWKVIGQISCPYCPPTELLGTTPDGQPVTAPANLFDVVGKENGMWIVDCPHQHRVLKVFWNSSQEWVEGIDNSKACFPAIKPVGVGR
jgi:hypothetical protein